MADPVQFRIPDQWDPAWFRQIYLEVLSKGGGSTTVIQGGGVSQGQVDNSIHAHNVDPFANAAAFDAHKAEQNPHNQYRLPVGSIFLTVGYTNPATLLGYGEWSLRAQGMNLSGASEVLPPSVSRLLAGDGSRLLSGDGFLLLTGP